jgi:hypothetical protein
VVHVERLEHEALLRLEGVEDVEQDHGVDPARQADGNTLFS